MTNPHKLSNYAVAVLVLTPGGVPLVMDPLKPAPRYWKFPGGRSQAAETPSETASRELMEETGIRISPNDLELLRREDRGNHEFFLFRIRLSKAVTVHARGEGDELVKLFHPEEMQQMSDLFPNHRALAETFLFKTKENQQGQIPPSHQR